MKLACYFQPGVIGDVYPNQNILHNKPSLTFKLYTQHSVFIYTCRTSPWLECLVMLEILLQGTETTLSLNNTLRLLICHPITGSIRKLQVFIFGDKEIIFTFEFVVSKTDILRHIDQFVNLQGTLLNIIHIYAIINLKYLQTSKQLHKYGMDSWL
jgi:hypothetical protein